MTNIYERAAREKKVFAIMSLLIKSAVPSSRLKDNLDNEEFWALVAQGTNLSGTSMETRRMVLEKLQEFDREKQAIGV